MTIPTVEYCLTALTPREWFLLARADENGPLPPCCRTISDLRDQMLGLLRMPTLTQAETVARGILDEQDHDLPEELRRFADQLAGHLDEVRPAWRTDPPLTARDRDLFEAQMALWQRIDADSPACTPTPRSTWAAPLADAVRAFLAIEGTQDTAVDLYQQARDALGQVLTLGAPPAVLLGLYQAARGLLQETVAPAAGRAEEVQQP